MKIAIIGSGPSAAAALTEAMRFSDLDIYLVDSGLAINEGIPLSAIEQKLVIKKSLGSEHPYRRHPSSLNLIQLDTAIPRSFAAGGLSLVWGATMLPYIESDCHHWALRYSDLEDQYREIAKYVPLAGAIVKSQSEYNDYSIVSELKPTQRFSRMLDAAMDSRLGVVPARVAIRTNNSDYSGCILCGECLAGCRLGHIWESAKYISSLPKEKYVRVKSYVDYLTLEVSGITLHVVDEFGQKNRLVGFDKIFLGAGVLETFRILAESKLVSASAILADSAISYSLFFSPFSRDFQRNESYALTQLAMRLEHKLKGRPAHLQLYEIGEEVVDEMLQIMPFLRALPGGALRKILRKFVIGIVYLPSELSPSIDLKIVSKVGLISSLNTSSVTYSRQKSNTRKILNFNFKKLLNLGIFRIPFAMVTKPAGSGVHTGSSFAIGLQTNSLGQFDQNVCVHIVDASVLPDIPAGPITYSVMANAARIIREVFS
jgi:hypothetical protein